MRVINLVRRAKGARKAISVVAVLALLLALLPAVPAMATASSVDVTADNYRAGAVTDYDVSFSVGEAVYAGDEIKVIFDSDFNLENVNPPDIEVTVSGTVYSFYAQKTGPIITLTYTGANEISAGSEYTVTIPDVSNPTAAGIYSVSVRAPAADPPVSDEVGILSGPPAALSLTGLSDEDPDTPGIQVTAGTEQTLTVELLDQYGNEGALAPAEGITVTLTDTDPEPNFGNAEEGTVEIAAGSSEGTVEWTPFTAMTVTISADAEGLTPDSEILTVLPAEPSELVLTGPTDLDVGERGTYTVSLLDEYGNVAVAGDGGVTVSLTSDPAGNFYAPPDAEEPTDEVTIPAGQTSADIAFAGDEAALTTVEVSADGLTGDEMQVAVGVTVLSSLGIEAPETAEVGIAVPVSISLNDQHGNPFVAPEGVVEVDLETDSAGTFFDAPANGAEIGVAVVPAGQSSVTVYYVPATDAVGTHTLSFVTDKILSNGDPVEENGVQAETVINVGTGAELGLVVSLPTFTAGQRAEITITVEDGHGNDVPAGPNGRVVYLETESPTGKFYAAAEGGNLITQVTIQDGKASAEVYYGDTESWTKKALEAGVLSAADVEDPADYSYTVAFRSEGVVGFQDKAIVDPAEATSITLDVAQQDVDAVPDEILTQVDSQIGATDLIGFASMRVGVVDQYGNPVPQNTDLRISVKDDSLSAFLLPDFAAFWVGSGAWATDEHPWLVVTAPGTYTVTASAGGFAEVSKQVVFEEPSLVIEAPAAALSDARVPVTVKLTNLWASSRDLVINLETNTENSAFYADSQTAEPITQAVIPAYESQVTVFLESDDPLGAEVELTASIADLDLTATATVFLGRGPDLVTPLFRGWNIISTPWALAEGTDTLDEILENPEYVEQAWGYKDGQWYQVTTAEPESMKLQPLAALYVKVKGQTWAVSWAQSGLGTPPVRDLPVGWNLVGNPEAEWIAADAALASIDGSYAVVISPAGCNQDAWVYTPPMGSAEDLEIFMARFRGYWVYMRQADTLAGLAMPPVQ